jgi:phospholipase C
VPDNIPPRFQPGDIPGTYDHTGYRVPLIVVSPFARKNFVSHTVMDYTAILKFIETRFNLPNLTARDKAQPDMTEFFDFVNPPWMTPPAGIPTQPTPGPCTFLIP